MFIPGIQPDDVQRLATVADRNQVWLQKHLLARLAQAPALASFAALASGATTNTAFGRDDSRPAHVGNLFQTMPPAVSFDPLHIMTSVALGSTIPAVPAALVATGNLPSGAFLSSASAHLCRNPCFNAGPQFHMLLLCNNCNTWKCPSGKVKCQPRKLCKMCGK